MSRVRTGETTLEEIDRELGEVEPDRAEPHPPPRILVVDDDVVARHIARALLSSQGFTVSDAVDGADALRQIATGPPVSLVLLDLSMPGMSGLAVLHELRGHVATSALPVVVLTASTDEHMEVASMDAGADDYVHKPFESQRFLARIKATLRRVEQQGPTFSVGSVFPG